MNKKGTCVERLGDEDFTSREALHSRVRELQSAGRSVRMRERSVFHGSMRAVLETDHYTFRLKIAAEYFFGR